MRQLLAAAAVTGAVLCLAGCASTQAPTGAADDALACGVTSTYAIDASRQTSGWLNGSREARDAINAINALTARTESEMVSARTAEYREALQRVAAWADGAYTGVRNNARTSDPLQDGPVNHSWSDLAATCEALRDSVGAAA